MPCAVQPRDLAVVRDTWRYKFLTAPQLQELWWAGGVAWPMQRRLRKLFDAGFVERFRPLARRGSYPWTYHLGDEGHRLLRHAGVIPAAMRFRPRAIYDYGHVLHELQLNAWVLALRRAAGQAFLAWDAELDVEPPREARPIEPIMIGDDWSVENLRDPRPRLIRSDAVLTLDPGNDAGDRVFFIEYDRTRRVDKNYEKFRRYDAFLTWWWRHTAYVDDGEPPAVVFVCQDPKQREQFVIAADRELTGHHWHPSFPPDRHAFPGRRWMLFVVEHDAHAGALEAWRLPPFPPDHPERGEGTIRRVRFASPRA